MTNLLTRLVRTARELCLDAGLGREAIVMELVLGGLVAQAGSPAAALEVFRATRQRAEAQDFADLAVQTQLAAGGEAPGPPKNRHDDVDLEINFRG